MKLFFICIFRDSRIGMSDFRYQAFQKFIFFLKENHDCSYKTIFYNYLSNIPINNCVYNNQ